MLTTDFNLKNYIKKYYKTAYSFAKAVNISPQQAEYWAGKEWLEMQMKTRKRILELILPDAPNVTYDNVDAYNDVDALEAGLYVFFKINILKDTSDLQKISVEFNGDAFIEDVPIECEYTLNFIYKHYYKEITFDFH